MSEAEKFKKEMNELETRISKTVQVAVSAEELPHTRYLKLRVAPVKDVKAEKYVGMSIEEIEEAYGKEEAVGVYPTDPKNLRTNYKMISTMIFGFAVDEDADEHTVTVTTYVRNWDMEWEKVWETTFGYFSEKQMTEKIYRVLATMAIRHLKRRYS